MSLKIEKLESILGSHDFQFKEVSKPDSIDDSFYENRYIESLNNNSINYELSDLQQFQATIQHFKDLTEPISQFLTNFNQELIKLSTELNNLKSKSLNLTSDLSKRQEIENIYTPIINDLIISPDLIRNIFNGEINENWCDDLLFLNDKQEIYNKYFNDEKFKGMKSLPNFQKLLNYLNLKCVDRIKNYMIKKIKSLRTIGTSSQIVQNDLLKNKYIFKYLMEKEPKLAQELQDAYILTMSWYYKSHFKRYLRSLEKMKIYPSDKTFLIGATSSESYFRKQQQPIIKDYNIGKRYEIINAQDPTVILGHIAESNNVQFHMEIGFRSFNLALVDNGSVEYLFLIEFFNLKNENAIVKFNEIFKQSYELGNEYTKRLISETFDIFGVLILIRLSQALIFELQKRRIPTLENYFNLTMIILWPKFQHLIDLNCESMKRSSSKVSVFSSIDTNPNGSNKPHFLTVRFVNLIVGFLKLNFKHQETIQQHTTQEPLYNSCVRLRMEFESIMTKINSKINYSKKDDFSFLLNNYSYIYSQLLQFENEGDADADTTTYDDLVKDELEHFKLLVDAYKV